VTTASVRLRDGRTVADEESGDPAGFPVLDCTAATAPTAS
jgi:hypothetical protein